MTTTKLNRIGSWTALLIGLPCGLTFSFIVLYISLFPMLDFGLVMIGGKFFWHPAVLFGFVLTFLLLLWIGGQRIKKYLEKDFSTLKTSFQFTIFVNTRLFSLLLIIFLIGKLVTQNPITEALTTFGIAFGLVLLTFSVSTAFTTFTIGLLIVTITKNKISAAKKLYNL